MRIVLLIACFAFCFSASAQLMHGTYYSAARSGLSLREKPDPSSKLLDKIPYGTKLTTMDEEGDWKEIVTEGMTGYWKKVTYNKKTGYVVDSYLLPWAPPKLATIKDLKQYLLQISQPAGAKVVTKSGTMEQINEGGWELTKQLYKNGSEYHQFFAYEYNSDTYFLPAFGIQQGFLLCRLIPEFSQVFGEKDEFPLADKTFKKNEHEYDIKVIRVGNNDGTDNSPFLIEKIKISFEDGAYYEFEMYMQENQLVIVFGGGV